MMFLGLAVIAPSIVIVPAVAHEVCNHMAQTTIPVYLTGKVGSIVYTPNRQGTAVRQLVTPKNPSTAGQTAQRQRFSAAAKAWAGPARRGASHVEDVRRDARQQPQLSFNAYVRVNITCQEVGTTPPTNTPNCPILGHFPLLELPSQPRVFDERVASHVADSHQRVLDSSIVRVVDDNCLPGNLRHASVPGAYERDRAQPVVLRPLQRLHTVGRVTADA